MGDWLCCYVAGTVHTTRTGSHMQRWRRQHSWKQLSVAWSHPLMTSLLYYILVIMQGGTAVALQNSEQLRKWSVREQLLWQLVVMLSKDKFYNTVCNTLLYIFELTFFSWLRSESHGYIYMYRDITKRKLLRSCHVFSLSRQSGECSAHTSWISLVHNFPCCFAKPSSTWEKGDGPVLVPVM